MGALYKIAAAALFACPIFLFRILEHKPGIIGKATVNTGADNIIIGRNSIDNVLNSGSSTLRDLPAGTPTSVLREITLSVISNGRYSEDKLIDILKSTKEISYKSKFPQLDVFASNSPWLDKTLPEASSIDGIAVLPKNREQFHAVFNKNPASGDLEEIKTVSRSISTNIITDSDNIPKSLGEFQNRLNNSSSDFIIITGHNERGFLIIPPPPTPRVEMKLVEIAEVCANAKKICVMISCRSRRYVEQASNVLSVQKSLTFLDAAEITIEIQRLIALAKKNNYKEAEVFKAITILINQLEFDQRIASSLQIAFVPGTIGGLGGAAIIITSSFEDD